MHTKKIQYSTTMPATQASRVQISTSEIEIALILFLDGLGVYSRASFLERRGLMGDEG
jgi:hypothetical protein